MTKEETAAPEPPSISEDVTLPEEIRFIVKRLKNHAGWLDRAGYGFPRPDVLKAAELLEELALSHLRERQRAERVEQELKDLRGANGQTA